MAMNLPAAIKSANEILALARQHEKKKFIASSSVMLTVEMVKISNAINAYSGEPTRETRTLEDLFEQCRVLEDQCRTAARRRMMVYGLLYKRGHIRTNWQMRMFVLDGGRLSYYQLGETDEKGHIMLHLVRKVSLHPMPMKRNTFKVETSNKDYIMQAPDEASLTIWMDALRPYKEGWLMKQGAMVKNWKRRWFVLYKTQLAYFEGPSGSARRDRKGFILLKEVLPGSVHPVEDRVTGHQNSFQIETKDRTFFLVGDTVDIMDDWLDAILRSIQTRGRLQSINQALEEDARDGPSGGEVSRDSSVMAPMSGADQAALQAKMRAAEEVDEEDAEGYSAGGTGAEDEVVTGDLGHEHINPDEISNAAALQAQLAKENFGAIDRKGPAQVDAHNMGALMEQHQQEMEIRQKEMEMEMKAKEHEMEMMARERELALKQRELELEMKALGMEGGMPEPEPAVPAVPKRDFILLAHSLDTTLLPEQRKCVVSAATVDELNAAVQAKLALPVPICVLLLDEDFDEFVLVTKLDDLPNKAKVQIKAA